MRTAITIVAFAAVLVAIVAGEAGAHRAGQHVGQAVREAGQTFETKVVFKRITPPLKATRGVHYFKGLVKSERGACRSFRPLELLRDGNVVETGSSDGDARFKLEIQAFAPGTYRVSAPVYSGGAGITCKADKSKRFVREI